MDEKKLKKIRQKLEEMKKSPNNRKSRELVSIAQALGRERDKRGKEPTYVRKHNPILNPPLSIPNHTKDLKRGTALSIINALLIDVDDWEIYFFENDEQ